MKIEIAKITNLKNETYYWVCINGKKTTCHASYDDALACFDRVINKEEERIEILKSEEI